MNTRRGQWKQLPLSHVHIYTLYSDVACRGDAGKSRIDFPAFRGRRARTSQRTKRVSAEPDVPGGHDHRPTAVVFRRANAVTIPRYGYVKATYRCSSSSSSPLPPLLPPWEVTKRIPAPGSRLLLLLAAHLPAGVSEIGELVAFAAQTLLTTAVQDNPRLDAVDSSVRRISAVVTPHTHTRTHAKSDNAKWPPYLFRGRCRKSPTWRASKILRPREIWWALRRGEV